MKKSIQSLFALMLVLLLASCSQETLDAKAIYKAALDNMNGLDSIKMTIDMDIEINSTDEASSLSMPMDITFVVEDMKTDAPIIYTEANTNILGATSNSKQWVKDGITYIDTDGMKSISEGVEFGDADEVLGIDMSESLTDMQAERIDDKINITASLPLDTFKELMASSMSDTSILDQFTMDNASFELTINNDNYIESMKLDTGVIDIEGLGNMSLKATYTYSDYGTATVPEFDPSEFGETGSYESGYVYGEYDLTIENADDLIAMGYQDMGEDVYYNGTYAIDLEYKQFTINDASIIYDWEYDQTGVYDADMNPICAYDHTFEEFATGDENICPISDFTYVREAYNELASSILE